MTSDGKGWTLAARFSNADAKNWMQDNGIWWYDSRTAIGNTTDPSSNMDMISMSFWLVNGTEFKITRSDDPQHTPLLQTTGNCLSGQTFRSKITSFGDFRNIVWGSDECKGQCTVQYQCSTSTKVHWGLNRQPATVCFKKLTMLASCVAGRVEMEQ